MESQSGNLELFETEFLKDFQKINITAVADYIINSKKSIIIIGDSTGVIRIYKREGSKLIEDQQIQVSKVKIDRLIANGELKILYILSGGSLFIRSLPNLNDKTPKESDKEGRDLKDIAKIVENECPKNKNELMIITKKKKVLFFYYNIEIEKLYVKEYKDKDKRPLEIVITELPDKIRWYGGNICYYKNQSNKVIFNIVEETQKNVYKLIKGHQDIPAEDIGFIQSSWTAVFPGGFCVFFETNGKDKNKNMINLNPSDPFTELEIISCFPFSSFLVIDIKNILFAPFVKNFLIETSEVSVVNSCTHFPSL